MINEYQNASDDWSDEVDKFDILMGKLHTIIEKVSDKQQFDLENRGFSQALKFTNEQLEKIITDLDALNNSSVIS